MFTGINTEEDFLSEAFKDKKEENKRLVEELGRLQKENEELKKKVDSGKFGVESIRGKENASSIIQFYTGIPSIAIVDWLIGLVTDSIKPLQYLSIPNQIFMTLMKLRLNSKLKDLAARFDITVKQTSHIITAVVPVLAAQLSFLIKWPSKEACRRTLPKVYSKTYPRCRVIIDCTEIFIEKPSNLGARSATWSNYKHHHTMKVLVGIAPTGAISFVSKCWGGRVSDKHLTQKSGFLNFIERGDQVLGDRGFLITEDIANCGAELIIPSFTKGFKQLPKRQVEISRQISRVRIHVERAIRRIKEFAIVKETYPISLIKHADSVVKICSALTNLQPQLVQ